MTTSSKTAARIRVAVIGGGQNCEHEVSLASATAVVGALAPDEYDVVPLTIGVDGEWRHGTGELLGLAGAVAVLNTCDLALPVLHGPRAEDGTVAALCELAGIAYVGSGVRAGALAMDKWATKLIAEAIGIATAPGVVLTPISSASYVWSHPVVVKPIAAGSSRGVTLVRGARDLAPAFAAAFALDDRVLVEDVVVGREIDVAVLGRPDGSRFVAPTLEVVIDGFFDFAAKYGGRADFRIPAVMPVGQLEEFERAAVAMYDALGCAGVARIDFFLTDDGPVLNEVNTMPGFTEQSQVPKMFAAGGTSYDELLDLLIRDALANRGTVLQVEAPGRPGVQGGTMTSQPSRHHPGGAA